MADQRDGRSPSATAKGRAQLPADRFESPIKGPRVGAHRMVMRPRRFWQYLIATVVGIAVLTGAGILLVQGVGSGVTDLFERGKPPVPVKQVEPEIDPEATVVVLNGTSTVGLQDKVAEAITKGKWGKISFSDVAASNEVKISAVFYTSKDDQAAALGLAKELGGVSTYPTDDYKQYEVRLVVLLGSDYAGPGSEKAASSAAAAD